MLTELVHMPWISAAIDIFSVAAGLLTLIGVGIGIWQILRTRSAVVAGKYATESTIEKVKQGYVQQVLSTSHRHVGELNYFVSKREWALAAIRCGDLADQLSFFAHLDGANADRVRESADDMRSWQITFTELGAGSKEWTKSMPAKWARRSRELSSVIDLCRKPLSGELQREAANDPS